MSDRLETVTITIGGNVWPYWSDFAGRAAAEEASREASFTAHVPESGGISPAWVGMEATVHFKGELWLTGTVRDFAPSHGGGDDPQRSVDVGLISKTADGVESSVDHPTGEARDVDLKQLGETFDDLGIGWESSAQSVKQPVERIITGESQWDIVERRARAMGAFIHDTPEGKFHIADKPEGTHAGALAIGVNISGSEDASAQFTETGRHDEVQVVGQSTIGTTTPSFRSVGSQKDGGIKRRRPRKVVLEGEATPERLKKRADTEARRAAGNGTTANIPVVGWRDEAGKLWTPNWLVGIDDEKLWLKGLMVIKSAEYSQKTAGDPEGTKATLELADPRALGGEDPKGESAAAYAPKVTIPTFRVDE